jgi:hypothetical protein
MNEKPVMHGRDHRWWGGTKLLSTGPPPVSRTGAHDPMPPDPYLVVMVLDNAVGNQIPSGSGGVNYSLNPANSAVSYGTNAPNIFELSDAGSGIYGFAVKEYLLYEVDASASVTLAGGATPAAGATLDIGFAGAGQTIGGNTPATWVTSPTGAVSVSATTRYILNAEPLYSFVFPYHQVPHLAQNSGATTSLIQIGIKVTARHLTNSNF